MSEPDELPPGGSVVRVTRDERLADEWALVLAAAATEHRVDQRDGVFHLSVAEADAGAATAALAAYDDEARSERAAKLAEPQTTVEYGRTFAGAVVAALILGFHAFVASREAWFAVGSASSARIAHGEPWRTVTALTLHVDWMHAFGNAAAAAIFVTAVCRWLGPGLGLAVILVAGAAGNAVTAWVVGAGHLSVGASTAVFGALGILCGMQFVTRRRFARTRARAWVSLGAGLALLGMLGVGERADVFAHAFGFAGGILLGLGAAVAPQLQRRRSVQAALGLAAAFTVVASWALALR